MDQIEAENASTSNFSIDLEIIDIYNQIENFEITHKRIPLDANIFSYYESIRYNYPQIYELAAVVFGVPATQVSVERAFSSLHFILNERRYNLNPQMLENLLFIKLNSK